MKKNIAILIDGANFYTTALKLGFEIDYKKLLLMYDCDVQRAIFFTGLPDPSVRSNLRKMVDWMSTNGYVCVTKIVKSYVGQDGLSHSKANMDVEIAVEAMKIASRVDEVHLFSGDGDFSYLVKNIQDMGAKVYVYSSVMEGSEMASMTLRKQADVFVEIKDIMEKIMKFREPVITREVKKKFWGGENG